MHQGMLALMNSFVPFSSKLKRKNSRYPIPWTVFTEPEISGVELLPTQLKKLNIPIETRFFFF
jgi:pyruvate/2-oxoglutarate dehydrogenase complex dihydrolipoamide dehydrogenase (E3) component